MGPLGELGALFNPGMRHEIEERKSKANRREEEGNARDGDLRIDLLSGVAVINAPARASAGTVDGPDQSSDDKAVGQPTADRSAVGNQTVKSAGDAGVAPRSVVAPTTVSHSAGTARAARAARIAQRKSADGEGKRAKSSEAAETPTADRRPSSKASRAAR